VGIELIRDKNPVSCRICRHGLGNVGHKIGLGARRLDGRGQDFACGDFEVGDQALRPMPGIFKLAGFHGARVHGQSALLAFQGLVGPR